ncbi:AMP-binding protein [Sphingomonas sp. ID0503]|uniref:AMP-binding protein n=1 Tax=Sphingomonas sp. ID0503 TaxID=3399691 RepID=UPI003AFB3010
MVVSPDPSVLVRYRESSAPLDGRLSSLETALEDQPTDRLPVESAGSEMLYSSGTTGRPKGVRLPMQGGPIEQPTALENLVKAAFGLGADSVYLTPAPMYHAAPLRWAMAIQALGGTVIMSGKFDPEGALAAIERYGVNASQWVPTHFVRLLKLPSEVKERYNVSSMKVALHAGAPCSIDVKRAMLDWWGPVLYEYYGGTEGFGGTAIGPEEWLARPGSVGRAVLGKLHICDDDGEEVEAGISGGVYFEADNLSEYFGDPQKTAESRNKHGWATYGDIGHVDKDGYLFLTDRKAFTIISGGVNIYPAEIENVLITHPKVQDVAVIGAPDGEMGERVVAVVQPVDPAHVSPTLAQELEAYARERLSGVKVPRQYDFVDTLPRQPTGKLFKRIIRERYWDQASIVSSAPKVEA